MSLDPTRPIRGHINHLYADPDDPACRGRYILVRIHPTPADLRQAARRYDRRIKRPRPDDDYDDACGMFQPSDYRSRYDRKTKSWLDTTPSYAGVIRLAMAHLRTEIIAHECTHAAIHLRRLHEWSKPRCDPACDLGDSCDDNEEAFAYLLGSMVQVLSEIVDEVKRRTQTAVGGGG